MAGNRACGRRRDSVWHLLPGRATRGFDPQPGSTSRRDGRPVEWPQPGMVHAFPTPVFNFAVLPNVEGEEAYWGIKQRAIAEGLVPEPHYHPIEMPRNSPTGFITAFFSTVTGFALIWHIWWVVILGLFGAFATFVWFAWRDQEEYEIPASEVARIDRERRRIRAEILLPSLGRRV
jgi:cytochrome o ubiquinol oxidase subunit 1